MRFPAARPRKTCDSVPLEMLSSPPAPPSLELLTQQTEIVLVSPVFLPDSIRATKVFERATKQLVIPESF